MSLREKEYENIILKSVILALVIFIMGFGIMNVLWFFYKDNSVGMKGLYYYRASTIGDALYLPLLIASCFAYISKNQLCKKMQKKFIVVVAVVMGIIGFFVQISWLRDDNIDPNWTIPKPHYFNVAGWYHAIFFTIMFALITYFFLRYVIELFYKNKSDEKDLLCETLIWCAGGGFLYEHTIDDYSDAYNYIILCLLIFSVLFGLYFVISLVCNKWGKQKRNLISVFGGLSFSLGVAVLIENKMVIIYALIYVLFSVSYIAINESALKQTFHNVINIMAITFALVSIAVSVDNWGISLFLFILIKVIEIIIAKKQEGIEKKVIRQHILIGSISSLCLELVYFYRMYITNFYINHDAVYQVLGLFVSVVDGSILFQLCKDYFYIEQKNEKERNKLERIRGLVYFMILCISLGLILQVFLTLDMNIQDANINFAYVQLDLQSYFFYILFGILIYIVAKLRNINNITKNKFLKNLYFLIFTISYLILHIMIYFHRSPFLKEFNYLQLLLIFLVLGLPLFIAESFYSNIIKIRGIGTDKYIMINAILIFVCNIITIVLCILPNEKSKDTVNIVDLIMAIIFMTMSMIVLPCLMGLKIMPRVPEKQVAAAKQLDGVLQNGILGCVLGMVGGVLVTYIYNLSFDFVCGICRCLIVMITVAWPMLFCMENNVEHLKDCKEKYRELATEDNENKEMYLNQYKEIRKHLRRQNYLTMFALLFYSLIPFLVKVIGAMIKCKDVSDALKEIIPDEEDNPKIN